MKLSAEEWLKKLKIVCVVFDPDGWDRTNYDESWNEKITKQTFFYRMDASTCVHKGYSRTKKKYCSCLMARPELVKEYDKLNAR